MYYNYIYGEKLQKALVCGKKLLKNWAATHSICHPAFTILWVYCVILILWIIMLFMNEYTINLLFDEEAQK